jgi:hypothetical protein
VICIQLTPRRRITFVLITRRITRLTCDTQAPKPIVVLNDLFFQMQTHTHVTSRAACLDDDSHESCSVRSLEMTSYLCISHSTNERGCAIFTRYFEVPVFFFIGGE